MDWQTFFLSAVIVSLLAFHIYNIEQKMLNLSEKIEKSANLRIERQDEKLKQILKVNLGEIIETSVDLRIKRQTEELKQILKVNLGEIIETSVDLRIKRQTEELKQILKDAESSYESKIKEALHEFKENLTITLESMKAANKTNNEDKDKVNTSLNNRVLKEVAHKKISTQSTQHRDFISGKANDGNLDTFSHTAMNAQTSFWEVDLGREFKIKQVEIFVRKDCCGDLIRQLDILVGPSHNKLEKCAFYEGPAQTGFHLVFECPHIISGRYVMIAKGVSTNLALAEVKVMAFEENSYS
ncbi:uncharacterized protein LOC127705436 isoform X2 [Mytilus californianus]|uniref:uncharacterized protein LOC127705436 isoform X2 n=1 Tax=Mytilus californianus TaxID=6549 RepID=UPI0022453755|nr:uncharacterized protein LOC127705436 isoform X2 [Mytilus californianus]